LSRRDVGRDGAAGERKEDGAVEGSPALSLSLDLATEKIYVVTLCNSLEKYTLYLL